MKAKDVPDLPILEFLAACEAKFQPEFIGCNHWPLDKPLDPQYDQRVKERSVYNAVPTATPDRVLMAKMNKLKRRGLIHGCCDVNCGCRGDFTITDKGRALLTPPK